MKTMRRTIVGVIAVLGHCCWMVNLYASPVDDLASPSQEMRDAAAKSLRTTYRPPSRTKWDALVSSLKIGTPQTIIEERLRSSNFVANGGLGSGNTDVKLYRLDDLWILACSFTNAFSNRTYLDKKRSSESTPIIPMSSFTNGALYHVDLLERLRDIWVEPPTNFTGIWRTYGVNGQPHVEIEYERGQRNGVMKTFYPDGSLCVLSHASNRQGDGEEVAFYPSGRIKYKGQYKAGHQVGHWIWYKEDGSIESEKDYGSK